MPPLPLAEITLHDVMTAGAIIGGLAAGIYTLIQIGDRLWRKSQSNKDSPSGATIETFQCHGVDHHMADALSKLVESTSALNNAMALHEKLAETRHNELVRAMAGRRHGDEG